MRTDNTANLITDARRGHEYRARSNTQVVNADRGVAETGQKAVTGDLVAQRMERSGH